jgi:UV DNA damage endonuclease
MSFNSNIKRIGFACKWAEVHPKKGLITAEGLGTGGTTLTWLNRQLKAKAEEKLWEVMKNNIQNTHNLVKRVATLKPELRMVRLTSDMLSCYTHPDWSWFYNQSDVASSIERWMAPIGETARANDVRLSFHPGQFCVLGSENPNIVEQSIKEFEYHTDMVRYMGYGKHFQDFKINVHISGKAGPAGVKRAFSRLSTEARNCITIENDEISWGIDSSLELADDLALVLDLHHNWIHTGEYIKANDDRIKKIIDSWRGVRPVVHYSVSREDYLIDHARQQLPDLHALMGSGKKKQHLRAHSDYYWNDAVNEWALSHNAWADVMAESKAKNLASFKLYDTYLDKQEKENVE